MRINPIYSWDKSFKGKIENSTLLKKALLNFTPEELAEFNNLKNKMAKVNDGKVFSVLNGTKFPKNEAPSYKDVFKRYVQLCSKEEDKPIEFYNEEFYRNDTGRGLYITEGKTDTSAFAKAILPPLRKLYGNK